MTEKKNNEEPNVYYSNSLLLQVSLYDFKFIFGQTIEGKHVDIVSVYMSPQHVKALKVVLDKNIELYDKKFPSIDLPDEVVKEIQDKKPTLIIPEGKS